MLGPFDDPRFGPWTDDRLPRALQEPYSAWGWARGDAVFGGGPKRPATALVLGGVLVGVCLVLLVASLVAGNVAALVVVLIVSVFLVPVGAFLLYAGSLRASWAGRVKRATGMSPFTMQRKHIDPPVDGLVGGAGGQA